MRENKSINVVRNGLYNMQTIRTYDYDHAIVSFSYHVSTWSKFIFRIIPEKRWNSSRKKCKNQDEILSSSVNE